MNITKAYKICYLLSTIFFFMTLNSCSTSTDEVSSSIPEKSSKKEIKFIPSIATRSAMESFSVGDNIGVYMTARTNNKLPITLSSNTDNLINNGKYTYSTSNLWSSSSTAYWKDGESVYDVIAYYPYCSISDIYTVRDTLTVNQTTETALRQCDFLYGRTDSVSYNRDYTGIALAMKHKFCRLNINVDLGTVITATNIKVSIYNAKNIALINLSTGLVTSSGTLHSISAYYDSSKKQAVCILPPQDFTSGTELVRVSYLDSSSVERRLSYTLNNALTLQSGVDYILNFTYTASGIKAMLTSKDLNK